MAGRMLADAVQIPISSFPAPVQLTPKTTGHLCDSGDGPLDIGEWLGTYFRERPLVTAGYAAVVLMFPLGGVVVPAMLGTVTDLLKDPNPPPGAFWPAIRNFAIVLFLLLGLSIVWFYLDSWLVADMTAQLRKRIYCEIMKAYSHNYQSIRVSSVIAKAINLPGAAFDLVRIWHNKIIPGIVIMVAVLVLMLWIDWEAPWSVLGVLATMLALGLGFFGSMYTCTDRVIAADYDNDHVQETIGDSFENLLHVYLANAAEGEVGRFQTALEEQNQRMQGARNCSNHFVGLLKVVIAIIAFVTFYLLYRRFKRGMAERPDNPPITTGKMASLVFVFMASTHVIYNTLDAWPRLVFKTAMVDKMQLFFNDLIAHARVVQPTDAPRDVTAPMLSYAGGTTFAYPGATEPVLRVPADRPVEFSSDDWVLVSGHIGSGKSTLAMLALGMYGYDDPASIRIEGREVRTLTRGEIAARITYVQQSPKLLNRSIIDNLRLGSALTEPEVRGRVAAFRRGVDAMRAARNDPAFDWSWFDLDAVAGKGGTNLSGGQRAMVCLIRAVLNSTPILICDELTANMDPATRAAVIDMIKQVAENKLLIYITHDPGIRRDIAFTKCVTMTAGVPTVSDCS